MTSASHSRPRPTQPPRQIAWKVFKLILNSCIHLNLKYFKLKNMYSKISIFIMSHAHEILSLVSASLRSLWRTLVISVSSSSIFNIKSGPKRRRIDRYKVLIYKLYFPESQQSCPSFLEIKEERKLNSFYWPVYTSCRKTSK